MCGIAGIIRIDGGPVADRDLGGLRDSLSHRGPDGFTIWKSPDESCGLVHLRLAIIDPDPRSNQPMTTPDGALSIIYNGEIFNFLELRDELVAEGVAFRTESDTEVLLEAWRRWGPDSLLRLNGMWALAIRDNRTGTIHFARDRFGIKPLLYALGERHFAFASEMRALLALPFVRKDIDSDVAARLLFDPMGVEASPRTLHKAIERLPAGHHARLEGGALTVRRWWRTSDHLVEPPARLEDASDRFRELFLDSIRLRMRSDVRIGTCLSGGFDSTAIVSGMAELAQASGGDHRREAADWRHAFIATFPGHAHDEAEQAGIAAAHARVVAHVADLGSDEAEADIESVLFDLDDVYLGLPTAAWKTYRHVRQSGIKVTLDGHGADELMGAYFQPGNRAGFAIRNLLGTRGFTADWARHFRARLGGDCFLRGHRLRPPPRLPIPSGDDPLPAHWGPLNRRLYAMFHGGVLPTILRNFDRLSMAHGVEVRMPFMDWRLVVFVMSLPEQMKFANGQTKWIARHAMRGHMPEAIRTNPRKIGFNSQMPTWLNGSLGQWALDLVRNGDEPEFARLVDVPRLAGRIETLSRTGAWNWDSVGRLWPYVNLKWHLRRLATGPSNPGLAQ
ncbi:MAG TPA: asparagine synthase (glutamine-hydrolyzing) [Allosphingosinicella sp.]|nr:asparagine synthase (glutamine-hydrolyzing) [Allosphingosinicella sp.]